MFLIFYLIIGIITFTVHLDLLVKSGSWGVVLEEFHKEVEEGVGKEVSRRFVSMVLITLLLLSYIVLWPAFAIVTFINK